MSESDMVHPSTARQWKKQDALLSSLLKVCNREMSENDLNVLEVVGALFVAAIRAYVSASGMVESEVDEGTDGNTEEGESWKG